MTVKLWLSATFSQARTGAIQSGHDSGKLIMCRPFTEKARIGSSFIRRTGPNPHTFTWNEMRIAQSSGSIPLGWLAAVGMVRQNSSKSNG